jgi:tetratricopeptide (TPR) repeat protein
MNIWLRFILFSTLAATSSLAAAAARDAWLELQDPPFTVWTDAGEKSGREVLRRIHHIHQVFRSFDVKELPLPIRVFVFSSESEFRAYRPTAYTQAFFQSGPERDYIALHSPGLESYRAVFHEYVHLALHHSSAHLPRWYEEGMAEYYSTLETANSKQDGERLRIGRVIPAHVETLLLTTRWLNAVQLAAVDRNAVPESDRSKVGLFYAQSWALVHMLNSAPGYRKGVPVFADLLATGTAPDDAFLKAFERPLDYALDDLRQYVATRRFGVAEVAIEPLEKLERTPARPIAPLEVKLARAELLLLLGRTTEVEKLFVDISRSQPATPEVETSLAFLALRQRRLDDARERLKRAIDSGSRDAVAYFEYAMLLRDNGSPDPPVLELLNKATDLNPLYAEAHFVLGAMHAKAGKHAEAIVHLRKAATILPRQSNFWHALAISYHEVGEDVLATRAALRAADAAVNEQELRMAEAAVKLTQPAPLDRAKGPLIRTPDSWKNLPGDARITGTLLNFECTGATAKLLIEYGGKPEELLILRPGKIPIQDSTAERREFTCGPQKPAKVSVEFIRATREVTAIRFE